MHINEMFHKIKIALLATLVLSVPLSVFAAEEADFVAIFEKYNDARKSAEIEILTGVLVKVQAEGVEECIGNTICGKHLIKNLKNDALKSYRVTNFVEFDMDGHIIKQRGNNSVIEHVSGPAAQIYYEGEEVRGDKGFGVITFIFEEGKWKISMISWEKRK